MSATKSRSWYTRLNYLQRQARSPLARYGVAVGSVLLAVILRALFDPFLGDRVPLIIFTLCVGISAYWGGLGPGLVTTALGGLLGTYLFIEIRTPADFARIGLYLINGLMISFLSEALHGARRRAESVMIEKERESAARLRIEEERIREARQASRLKDEFLSIVSHELRTPLNAIVGWLHLLKSGRLNEADKDRAIETIDRNVKLQTKLIEDMLDASRIITGKLRIERQPLKLAQALQSAVESIRTTAEAKLISISIELEPDGREILGDEGRIQQVLWHLLFNSIKFTPRGGRVEIHLESRDECAQIRVRDTGIGIRPDFLPYVFDQFRQADSSITRAYGGMGLGLTIVRYLVELHGGTIMAESEGQNCGSTFTVALPYNQKENASPAPAGSHVNGGSQDDTLDGIRILLVDDEPDTLEIISLLLAKRGAEVRPASSVAEAMKILTLWNPDALVADIGMPGEDGYSFISRVRALQTEHNSRVPALALTAYADAEDRDRALAAGFQQHLSKPVEPDELASTIAELVGRPLRSLSRHQSH